MNKARVISMLLVMVLICGLCGSAAAAETDCDSTYCFSPLDFTQEESVQTIQGICVLTLPEASAGTVMLGSRVIRPGDILTAGQVEQMTFSPMRSEADQEAVMTYLPIYENHVAPNTTMTISIRGKKDEAPIAEDFALETYKNLANESRLKACDPEGQELTYTVTRQPRRGTLELSRDGTFVYTPKKNKVGVDSFTYTAADPAGNVSREATVTIQILKPTESARYTDTAGLDCRFEAEWLRNTGLFTGEKLADAECFQPDKVVSRAQFMTMLLELLDIPVGEGLDTLSPQDLPEWLKPYYAAALRAGLTADLPREDQTTFRPEDAITGEAAAVMLQSALDLGSAVETASSEEPLSQTELALAVLRENGITLEIDELTRSDVAKLLYQVSQIAPSAPGTAVYRLQN